MAQFHGKGGSVTFTAGTFEDVISWTVNATADVAEGTNMGSTNDYKEFLAGFSTWTATVETQLNSSGFAALATSATLSLLDGTLTFAGTAICTGYAVNNNFNEIETASYTFQGNAQPTHA